MASETDRLSLLAISFCRPAEGYTDFEYFEFFLSTSICRQGIFSTVAILAIVPRGYTDLEYFEYFEY